MLPYILVSREINLNKWLTSSKKTKTYYKPGEQPLSFTPTEARLQTSRLRQSMGTIQILYLQKVCTQSHENLKTLTEKEQSKENVYIF